MSDTTFHLRVDGMHCASCGLLIDETLEELPGVRASQTSVRTGRTTVVASGIGPAELVAAIGEAGYTAMPLDTPGG